MSNFWAKALGGAAPVAPAPAAPQQQASGPWWATPQPYHPAPAQHQQTVPQQQYQPVQDDGQQKHIGDLLRDPHHVPKKAKVLKQSGQCPDCGSGDYFRSPEHPKSTPRCQECGFNDRFHQSAVGVPSGGPGQAASTPTKQTAQGGANGRSNYNPHMLIRGDS